MNRPLLLALVTLVAGTAFAESASARDYDYDNRNHREERRRAIVAGAVRKEIAQERADDRYQECVRGSSYDEDCERQRYRDEREARAKARRTAIIVGADD